MSPPGTLATLRPRPGLAVDGDGVPQVGPPDRQVAAALEAGVRSRRMVFPDAGPPRALECWKAYAVDDADTLRALRHRAAVLAEATMPASRAAVLTAVMALMSHYRSDKLPDEVGQRLARDWVDDLSGFPAWAIEDAARTWRRTKVFKPQVCEVIALCERSCGEARREAGRIAQLLEATAMASNPMAAEAGGIARAALRRI